MSELERQSVSGEGRAECLPRIATWREANRELNQDYYDRYEPKNLNPMPDDVTRELGIKRDALFAAMWESLSPDERACEGARLNAMAIAHSRASGPSGLKPSEFFEAGLWHAQVVGWALTQGARRAAVERPAQDVAELALQSCVYLGGLASFPTGTRERVRADIAIASWGFMRWQDRREAIVCQVPWAEITGLRVGPTDRTPERVTATRVGLLGVFALAAKKTRREAMLGVKTGDGEALFIVEGHTPLELEAQLAPLASCVGVPTADSYQQIDSGITREAMGLAARP